MTDGLAAPIAGAGLGCLYSAQFQDLRRKVDETALLTTPF
jgi:hypothetical protein